jgi:hypothetical protein
LINQETARRIAAEYIGEGSLRPDGVTPVILDDKTIERDFGWVFFYQSREHIETGDFGSILLGNAPVIVDRDDGSLHVTGTAQPIESYLAKYKAVRSR